MLYQIKGGSRKTHEAKERNGNRAEEGLEDNFTAEEEYFREEEELVSDNDDINVTDDEDESDL